MRSSLFSVFLLFCLNASGQIISESILNSKEKFDPLFGKESSILSIDYVRNYEIGKSDTLYFLDIFINNKLTEAQSVSLGSSIFGSGLLTGSSFGINTTYSTDEQEGNIKLNREDYLEFYTCVQTLYTFISKRQKFSDKKLNTVATCSIKNLSIGAEYDPAKPVDSESGLKFYFKLGDETIYRMTKSQFENTMGLFRKVKSLWN